MMTTTLLPMAGGVALILGGLAAVSTPAPAPLHEPAGRARLAERAAWIEHDDLRYAARSAIAPYPPSRFMTTEQFKKEQVALHKPRVGRAASPLATAGAQRTARPTCGDRFMAALLSPGGLFPTPSAPAEPWELLRDPDFRGGFALLAAKAPGRGIGRIGGGGTAGTPLWQLAQWHSRFEFTNFIATTDSFAVANVAKWLCLERTSAAGPRLTLGVDSRAEYDGRLRQTASEPWVHLLVQQAIQSAPSIAEAASLRLRFMTRLREAETFRPAGHSPSLHAAQFQVALTVNNTRRDSPGFGDFLWFVVPVYDDRYAVPPPHIAQDFAVTKGKLIYNPGAAALAANTGRAADWLSFDADVRPWLERALRTAWDKGYLPDSRDLADYRLAHINVGWEVPGLNRVAMDLRGLSLTATAPPRAASDLPLDPRAPKPAPSRQVHGPRP